MRQLLQNRGILPEVQLLQVLFTVDLWNKLIISYYHVNSKFGLIVSIAGDCSVKE